MPELKPCPFCGSTPSEDSHTLTDGGFKYGAIACGCGAIGPDVRTGYKQWPEWKEAAVAEWNERAITADKVLVPRELLERAANVIWQESVARTGFSSKLSEELRALLHP